MLKARNTDAGRTTSLGMLSTPELGELMTWRISSQSSTAFSGQFLQLSGSKKCEIRLCGMDMFVVCIQSTA